MNTLEGPKDSNSYAFKENVSCTYLENDPNDPITGFSKKFRCLNDKQKRLKIKYDPFNNTEVFGEIAATRVAAEFPLLQATG